MVGWAKAETIHPAIGSFDLYPEEYHENNHHTTTFIFLSSSKFANYSDGKSHWGHDHSWDILDRNLTIKCWENYDNTELHLVGEIHGKFNDDWTEIKIDEKIYIRVSNKSVAPGQVKF